ncbi:MAG TPA: hypothetical protein VGQ83_11480 [Polyangia bacterium]|jgi:hypothetical protein
MKTVKLRTVETRRFRVRIFYREPTYETRFGPRPDPHRWTYEVEAAGEDEAERLARARFRGDAESSWVGWVRQIVDVEVAEVR